MDVKKLVNKLIKTFPKIQEVKSLVSYILQRQDFKKEELITYWLKIDKGLDRAIINKVIDIINLFYLEGVMPKDVLTEDLLKYAKKLGNQYFLRFLVDVRNSKVYILPPKMKGSKEHVDAAVSILGLKNREDIKRNPEIAKHLVDCYISIEEGKVKEILVHYSLCSLVTWGNVKYEPEDIDKAYGIIWKFVHEGKIPYEIKRFTKNVA